MTSTPIVFRFCLPFAACTSLFLAACSSPADNPGASAGGGVSTGSAASGSGAMQETTAVGLTGSVTFHRDVEPILQRSCQGCHVAGGIAPFPLVTYADASPQAALMASVTSAHVMPPWGAESTADCTPRFGWKDDERLSDADIATISAWASAGAPEGDPADAPPPRPAAPAGLADPSLELVPSVPYTVSSTGDQFRCFVLDPHLTADTFVNGMNVVPGNSQIVHHVIVFTDSSRASASLADANGQYDCFGGPGFTNTGVLTAWAPGGRPIDLPSNVGYQIAKGSLLVMQVHYHPHDGASLAPDATKVQLRFSASAPAYQAATTLVGNFATAAAGLQPGPDDPPSGPKFIIPAGAKDHVETMQLVVPSNFPTVQLYGVAAHMHYLGIDERITVHRANPQPGEPADECMLEVPHWDFDWQRFYAYDAPIEALPFARPGDTVTIRCTYDNTLDNPKLAEALAEQHLTAPKDVALGETTLDEMCLAGFLLVAKAP